MKIQIDGSGVYLYTGTRQLEPKRATIVFVHGAGLDHTVWLLQSRYFAHHGWNAIAVDLPGHGLSDGPALTSIDVMAKWILTVLDVLDLGAATIAGHSMGSLVALETGARAPDRVAGLVLLGTSAPMPVSDALLSAAKANQHMAFDMINLWGHGRSAQFGGNPVPGVWMTGVTMRLLERSGPGVLYRDLNACHTYEDGLLSARKVRCPVLVVCATQDRMTPPSNSQSLIDQFENVRVTTIDRCGHQMLSEQPDQVLDALKEFVSRR